VEFDVMMTVAEMADYWLRNEAIHGYGFSPIDKRQFC
jgi:hypothetical protein